MFKTFTATMLSAGALAGSNGYSRGVPPTTQNCNSYPMNGFNSNTASQSVAWGLTVDIEFGGCRCYDEDEMEFGPTPANYADNNWSCKCLNSDLYLDKPEESYSCFTAGDSSVAEVPVDSIAKCVSPNPTNYKINDANGKNCGVVPAC